MVKQNLKTSEEFEDLLKIIEDSMSWFEKRAISERTWNTIKGALKEAKERGYKKRIKVTQEVSVTTRTEYSINDRSKIQQLVDLRLQKAEKLWLSQLQNERERFEQTIENLRKKIFAYAGIWYAILEYWNAGGNPQGPRMNYLILWYSHVRGKSPRIPNYDGNQIYALVDEMIEHRVLNAKEDKDNIWRYSF